jgi:hypothetical protein
VRKALAVMARILMIKAATDREDLQITIPIITTTCIEIQWPLAATTGANDEEQH